MVLSSTFAVSHNVPETKVLYEGAEDIATNVRARFLCRAEACVQCVAYRRVDWLFFVALGTLMRVWLPNSNR